MEDFRSLQGRDVTMEIIIKVNGVVLNLSVLDGYSITVEDSAKKPIVRYSKNAVTGYIGLDSTNEVIGKIAFHLSKDITKNLSNVQLFYVVTFQQPVGGDPYYDGSNTSNKLIFIERSSEPILPDLS